MWGKWSSSKNKSVTLMLALVMALQIFVGGFGDVSFAADPVDLGNIFTFTSLTLNGNDIGSAPIELGDDDLIIVQYAWEVIEASDGDYATIDVPEAFVVANDFTGNIVVDGTTVVGTYTLTAGTNELRFVFNENIQNLEVKNGIVGFGLEFNMEKFNESTVQIISFNDSTDKALTITAKPEVAATAIDKFGVPDATKDAKEIEWTVDIINTEVDTITGASIVDVIPEGLDLVDSSVKVYELAYGYSGDKTLGELTALTNSETDTINIENLDMEPYQGYRIVYTTTIIDMFKTEFTNTATLTYGANILPAEATVDKIERSSPIEKSGVEINKNKIRWTIDINKNATAISDAILEDSLQSGLTLDKVSINVYKLKKSGNNWNIDGAAEGFTLTDGGFPIGFGDIAEWDAFRVVFETDVEYTGDYNRNNDFENTAILKSGEDKIGEAKAEVRIQREPILTKSSTSNIQPGDGDKIITWTIEVNKAKHNITNAVVTDTLPAGLTFLNDGDNKVIITKNGTEIADYTDVITSSGQEIIFALGDIGIDTYKIVFKTKITDFTKDSFNNVGVLTGTGVGEGTNADTTNRPNNNIYSKIFKAINYNEKTMDWEIVINPRRENIEALKLTDIFPNNGLILLEETLEVKQGTTTLGKGTDYTLTENGSDYSTGFILEFTGEILPLNKMTTVTYKTSFDPEKGIIENTSSDYKYINRVDFDGETVNGNTIDLNRTAEKIVEVSSWNSGKKLGRRISIDDEGISQVGWISGNTRKIEWEVYINYLKQNLGEGVTVKDDWTYEGLFNEESLKVYSYNVAANGETSIGEELTSGYTVLADEDGFGWRLSFTNPVLERYVIVYTTDVPEISQSTYTNNAIAQVGEEEFPYAATVSYDKWNNFLDKAALNVDGGKVYTDDELFWELEINDSLSIIENAKVTDTVSSGMAYLEDSMQVYKIVGEDEVLVDADSEQGYSFIFESNDDGTTLIEIEFKATIDQKYIIRYSTIVIAEEGTVNNRATFGGDLVEEVNIETEELSARQFSFVGGETRPGKGKIIIVKTDGDTEQPIDAGFSLYYLLNGEKRYIFEEQETENGILEANNLTFRTYYLEEISAPSGYMDLDGEVEIVLSKDDDSDNYNSQTRTKTIEVINYKYGNLSVVKVDSNDSSIKLEGAEFSLVMVGYEEATILTTDSQGEIIFEELPQGDYVLTETKAPEGYEISQEEYSFTIGNTDEGFVYEVELEISNEKLGRLEIVKVDKTDNTKKLKGAEFSLYNKQTEETTIFTTDELGEIKVEGLSQGTYELRESKAPVGYKLNEEVMEFIIGANEYDQALLYEYVKQVTVENEKRPASPDFTGSISIKKMDKDDNSNKLEGAEFELRDGNGKLVQVLVTDKNGNAKADDLEYGEYTLEETRAPKGYALDSSTFETRINRTNQNEVFEVYNEKEPTAPVVPVDPTKPVNPNEPGSAETPGTPSEQVKPDKPGDNSIDINGDLPGAGLNPGGILPKTGGTDINKIVMIIGTLILALGAILAIDSIRRKSRY